MNRFLLICTAVLATGCTAGEPAAAPAPESTRPPVTLAASTPVQPPAGLGRCPVTRPSPTGPPGVPPASFFGWGSSYGNGRLWVGGLGRDGVIRAIGADTVGTGPIRMKLGWWRATTGDLRITGRRLDGPAPALTGHAPEGYGNRGFQASAVTFPAEGCWQVTGAAGTAVLTFVTYVTR